jgi:hypothetical protein
MNIEKRGRGRPKGAKSFVQVCLSDLNDLFRQHQIIPVSRVWAESLNLDVKEEKKIEVKNQKLEPEEKIQMQLKK